MNSKVLLSLALLLFVPTLLSATRFGILTGKVIDASGKPIPGAAVELLKTVPRAGGYTKTTGIYRVSHLVSGTYRVVAISPGYASSDTMKATIRAGATTTLDITLKGGVNLANRLERYADEPSAYLVESVPSSYGDRKSVNGLSLRGRFASAPMAAAPMFSGSVAPSGKTAMRVGDGIAMTALPDASKPASSDGKIVSKKGDKVKLSKEEIREVEPIIEQSKPTPGQLTAGEWNDLDNWSFWLDIASSADWSAMIERWGYEPSTRVSVRVADGRRAVVDNEVRLVNEQGVTVWTARTDNRGCAELFAGIVGQEYRLEVMSRGQFVSAGQATPGSETRVIIPLPGAASKRNEFDLMFVVDATGSMGDEISYIKAELENVIERIRETSSDDLQLRLSCNFYRDNGDEYVVRPFPFSESTFDMIGNLREQYASGGGDFEEAVEEALADAIDQHEWREYARARLLFLVLDAPPHYTPERLEKLHALTSRAASKGIRIIPIASSGINKETEFLLRLFGIYTGGTYAFLTDDSGIGESHLKPTVGTYQIEYLNDLMVRVISRYLAVDELTQAEREGMELR